MKKIGILGIIGIIGVIIFSIVIAGNFGKTTPAFATGSVVLGEGLENKAAHLKTLYIIVHDENSPMPMPFGALRKTLREGPEGEFFDFVLTYDRVQRMREDAVWPAKFKLKARLDRDGAAGPDQPGDIVGEITGVSRGTKGVRIVLDREIK